MGVECSGTGCKAVKFTFQRFISIKYKQRQMKTLCLKYFQHINKIISIMQPNLTSAHKPHRYEIRIQNRQQTPSEDLLEEELSTLKQNIQNLLKYCHRLQNRVKIIQRSNPSNSQILQQNYYEVGSMDHAMEKGTLLESQSGSMDQKSVMEIVHKENMELKKTRELYLGSLNKIHLLKQEVSNLTQALQHFTETCPSSPTPPSHHPPLHQSCTFPQLSSFPHHSDPDISHLLCDQDLSSSSSSTLKENNPNTHNQAMIESLIAKGIEFRDQRMLKSSEFKHLSQIVERYREEALNNFMPMIKSKSKSISYR